MNNLKKIIKFFEGVCANENGKDEMDALREELTEEENELLDVFTEVMIKGVNHGAELMTCALMQVYQSDNPEKDGSLQTCIECAGKTKFNPMLLVACLKTLGCDNISQEWLLREMMKSIKNLLDEQEEEDEDKENHAEDPDSVMDDFREQLKKFLNS